MMTTNRSTFGLLSLAALVASACADPNARNQPPQRAQQAEAIAAPPRLEPRLEPPPERLSPVALAALKARMASHSRDMDRLVSAIMVLDYADIARRANGIVADVSLSRPLSGDASELNASLPEKFFVRQDDLKMAARALSAAASALDPYRVADAYGKVSEGCVRCHADYRPRTGS
jgi:hypothetical protein